MKVAEFVVPAVAVRLAVIPARLRIVRHDIANVPRYPIASHLM